MDDPGSAGFEVQRRTPRNEAMESMLSATVDLLTARSPEDVTIRDVAAASGHHHRFVQAWFGGKTSLFRAAFDRMGAETAGAISETLSGGGFDDKAFGLARLLNWLVATDAEGFAADRPTPIIDRVAGIYTDALSVEPDMARLLAARAVGTALSLALFRDVLGLDSDDVTAIASLDREMVGLLAATRLDQQQN